MPLGRKTDESSADEREWIARLRQACTAIRNTEGAPEMSFTAMEVFLLIAEHPGQPLSWIEQQVGKSASGVQRVLMLLGAQDRTGKPGLQLVEDIADPARPNRRLFFVSHKGDARLVEALQALTKQSFERHVTETAAQYIARIEAEGKQEQPRVITNAFASHQIANAKRALRQKGERIGRYTVAFPLRPALVILEQIEEWLSDNGGRLYRLPTMGKPDGMALVDLPDANEQFHFVIRFRGPHPVKDAS